MKNSYSVVGELLIVYVVRKSKKYECLFDYDDLNKLQKINAAICFNNQGYLVYYKTIETNKRRPFLIHRYLMDCYDSKTVVDHANGNKQDNTRKNLRICTKKENNKNIHNNKYGVSGIRNVHYIKRSNKWGVRIQNKWFGTFSDIKKAAEFAEKKRIELFGEFSGKS